MILSFLQIVRSEQASRCGKTIVRRQHARRQAGGASALETSLGMPGEAAFLSQSASLSFHEKGFPQLAMVTEYSPQKLAFAASTGYQGVVLKTGRSFHAGISDAAIDAILAASRQTGVRIISIECMGPNHIDPDSGKRRLANESFIHCLEFAHRLGCKFVGTFSGRMPGASMSDQAKALAEVAIDVYIIWLQPVTMRPGFFHAESEQQRFTGWTYIM